MLVAADEDFTIGDRDGGEHTVPKFVSRKYRGFVAGLDYESVAAVLVTYNRPAALTVEPQTWPVTRS